MLADVVTHFMFSFFAGTGTYRYHVVRVYTLSRPCEIARRLAPARTSAFPHAQLCVRAVACTGCCNGKLLQKSTCVCVCVYMYVYAHRGISKAPHPRVLPLRHYRRPNPIYTGGYPAKIRLGWRLAYDVDCRKSWKWMVRCNEDSDFKSTRACFHVSTASIKGAPRCAIASDRRFYREISTRERLSDARGFRGKFSSLPTHFRMQHFPQNKSETSARSPIVRIIRM